MKDSSEAQTGTSADIRVDVRAQLERLQLALEDLRIRYEQYFAGVYTIAPEKQHRDVLTLIRLIRRAPYKNSAMNFQFRTVETRYNTLNTYWQRVLREREDGTYSKDVFKANLREKAALDAERAQTQKGRAEGTMRGLYDSYRRALEKETGHKQNIDFETFQRSLIQRAKDFKERHGAKKLSFSVVVKDGKVSVKATAKEK